MASSGSAAHCPAYRIGRGWAWEVERIGYTIVRDQPSGAVDLER
jgi:hypothetical protein